MLMDFPVAVLSLSDVNVVSALLFVIPYPVLEEYEELSELEEDSVSLLRSVTPTC
jgi:hypothetical protein